MSDFQPNPVPAAPQTGPTIEPAPKKRPSWLVPVVVAVVAASIGYGAAGGAPAAAEPEVITETKEVEVVKEVEVPVEKIVEVEVEVTPAACLEALDLAGEGLGIAAAMVGHIQPAAMAGLNRDVPAIEAITADMAASNVQLEELTPKASAASAECRSAADPNS